MNIPEPVEIASISNHFDKQKTAAILLMLCGPQLLLQTYEHEGGLVCDAFGTFVGDGDTAQRLTELQKEHFGASFPTQPAGTAITYINKPQPDGRVQLAIDAYLVELSQQQKSQLQLKQNQLWLDTTAIDQSGMIREDDKLLFMKALANRTLSIILEVDQPGRWIDAKLVAWVNSVEVQDPRA